MTLSKNKVILGATLLIAIFAFLYFFTGVFGETRINLTLRTNPDLENGLVAHYTLDSTDVNGSTVSDSVGSSDGTLYIDATTNEVVVDDANGHMLCGSINRTDLFSIEIVPEAILAWQRHLMEVLHGGIRLL